MVTNLNWKYLATCHNQFLKATTTSELKELRCTTKACFRNDKEVELHPNVPAILER